MSSSQITGFADELGKASLRDHSSDVPTAGKSTAAAGTSEPSQANLLGIPQELRNKIFEYVFDVLDATGGCVGLLLNSPYIHQPGGVPYAAVKSTQAPPSKDPLLVCRQLHAELRLM